MFGPARCVACRARAGWLCSRCAREAAPPATPVVIPGIARALSPWTYEGGPRALVLALKLRHMRSAAVPLVAGIVGTCRSAWFGADAVTWVPARARDQARRGFDHAEVLGRGVAHGLGLPPAPVLRRTGMQPDQAGLSRAQRLSNLDGAFGAVRPVTGHLLLIDDLVTTGATAAACAACLVSAGATQVTLATACVA